MSAAISAEASTTAARGRPQPNRGRGRGRGTPHTGTSDGPSPSQSDSIPVARSNRGRGRAPVERERSARDDSLQTPRGGGGRRRKFGAQLTSPNASSAILEPTNGAELGNLPQHKRPQQTPRAITKLAAVDAPIPVAQDLTTRLTESMCKPPYADCPICFNEIHPLQPTWSCAISEETNRCCWTVFHNKCIVAWSKKSEWAGECAYSCEISIIIVLLQTSRKAEMRIEQEMRIMMASGDVLAAKRSGLPLRDLTGGNNRTCNICRLSQRFL